MVNKRWKRSEMVDKDGRDKNIVNKRLKRWEDGWLKIEEMKRWLIEDKRNKKIFYLIENWRDQKMVY